MNKILLIREINRGRLLESKGQWRKAERTYRKILETNPTNQIALNVLNLMMKLRSRLKDGRENIILSDLIISHNDHKGLNIASDSDKPSTLVPVSTQYRLPRWQYMYREKRLDLLKREAGAAIKCNPKDYDALHMMGLCLLSEGRNQESLTYLLESTKYQATNPELWDHLGVSYGRTGQLQLAHKAYLKSTELAPNRPETWNNAAKNANSLYRYDLGISYGERSVTLDPRAFVAWNNLGMAYSGANQLEKAQEAYQKALEIKPDYVESWNNLANLQKDWGHFSDAESSYKEALRIKPDYCLAFSNRLFTSNYRDDLSLEEWYGLYREFSERYELPLKAHWPRHKNNRSLDRKLKIGYVSGDFRDHAVAKFLEPVFEHHDRARVEVICFNASPVEDAVTVRFKALSDGWHDLTALNDDEASEYILKEEIDILVDLSGHTYGNRLMVFARKPAPVQMTWLGYGATTGLQSIDYFLCDERMLPSEYAGYCSEAPGYLPVHAAFQAPKGTPDVNALPALKNGYITFGSLARTSRINQGVIATWSRLLKSVPTSRLILDQRPFQDAGTREDYWGRFEAEGVTRDRVSLTCSKPHWLGYQDIDIALDPFPHNAGTTTYEALWMGVPVISKRDRPPMGRFGDAILGAAGLSDWVVDDEESYVARGIKASNELRALSELRLSLRDQLKNSPLMDAKGFTHALENLYIKAWQKWAAFDRPQWVEHYKKGKFDYVRSLIHASLQEYPNDAHAHHVLGLCELALLESNQAERSLKRSLDLNPNNVEVWDHLGVLLNEAGRFMEAKSAFDRGFDCPKADTRSVIWSNAAKNLTSMRLYSEALEIVRKALSIDRSSFLAWDILGVAHMGLEQYLAAESAFKTAFSINPKFGEALNNLGTVLLAMDRSSDAEKIFLRLLSINPNHHQALNNLGVLLKDCGRFNESLDRYKQSLIIKPDNISADSNLLFAVNYHPDLSSEELYQHFQRFGDKYDPDHKTTSINLDDRRRTRKLRIGYVSPDFKQHACRYFLLPLLENHDRSRFELFAYAEVSRPDAMTHRFQGLFDHWISTVGVSTKDLCNRIRADGIDVLIDLAGHTAGNRLDVFALKPAPVSLSWVMGYGYTTGLKAIDYFLADDVLVPEGSERFFSERVHRMEVPYAAYTPTQEMGEVGDLPAIERGYITFGSLTRVVRMNHRVIRVWSELLSRLPESRLVLDSKNFRDEGMVQLIREKFELHGISGDRLEMGYHSPPWDVMRGFDIGLDCFPHNSGTTLFESLYMGIPFITLADRPSAGRLGSSILTGLGRLDWIATNEREYVEKALLLASDWDRLGSIRRGLREGMRSSPLMDGSSFARKFEASVLKLCEG